MFDHMKREHSIKLKLQLLSLKSSSIQISAAALFDMGGKVENVMYVLDELNYIIGYYSSDM